MTELRDAVVRFDGTHTAELKEALPLARASEADLIALCLDPETAIGATWLVKALVEAGDRVGLASILNGLEQQTDWGAQLHLLQCVQFAPEAAVDHVLAIEKLLCAQKVLVRVWALDAFVRVAGIRPDVRHKAVRLIARAEHAEQASLRARARKLKDICAGW